MFNVIGSIIMMIIDKKDNLKTLFSLGATVAEIKKIFVIQGFLLTFFGMISGLFLGVILVLLQKEYGWFMITESLAYPVEFRFSNLLVVVFTITILGYIAAKIARWSSHRDGWWVPCVRITRMVGGRRNGRGRIGRRCRCICLGWILVRVSLVGFWMNDVTMRLLFVICIR